MLLGAEMSKAENGTVNCMAKSRSCAEPSGPDLFRSGGYLLVVDQGPEQWDQLAVLG